MLTNFPVNNARISDVQYKIDFRLTNKIQFCDRWKPLSSNFFQFEHVAQFAVTATSANDLNHCDTISTPIDLHLK